MKKITTIFAVLCLLLGLCACGGHGKQPEQDSGGLQVGFGRTVITPEHSVPLAGYGNTSSRLSETIMDELYATCVAVTDQENNTVLLISQDLIGSYQHSVVRTSVSMATGVSQDRIFVAGTHTHSAPDQRSNHESMANYNAFYLKNVVDAAKAAMEDRAPASASIGSVETQGMNFVRHYLMNDGTYAGDNFGSWSSGIKAYAEPNDPQLQVIRFDREDKQDVLMVNWQVHPKMTGGATVTKVSADFIAYTRKHVETKTGSLMVYFTGAAGNQNPSSVIRSEKPTDDPVLYGNIIGDYVIRAVQNMTPVEVDLIKSKKVLYNAKVDLVMQDKMQEAKEVQALYKEKGRNAGDRLARAYGFSSVYHANAVISRSSYGKSQNVEVNAFAIGNIGFVTASYEMFASHGATIKADSPYDMTFVITCCNGGNGYIPTQAAHEYGCYESHTGLFIPGTGEALRDTLIESLEELKN